MKTLSLPRYVVLSLLAAVPAHSEVKMPAIFGDHMVLQQDVRLPVWGTADPGESVTVEISGRKGVATADAGGKWMVHLDPLPVNGTPVEMKVTGRNTLAFTDVLVGDVWLCSGQSNMEFGIGNTNNAKELAAQMNIPQIRLFLVAHNMSFEPLADVKKEAMRGQWVVCTPQSVLSVSGWNGFSAVGLLFAREIHELRKQPIGLIGSYWGGTGVQSWTSLEVFQKNADIGRFETEFANVKTNFPEMVRKYREEDLPTWEKEHAAWKQQVAQPSEPGAQRPKEPKKPVMPGEYPQYPCVLFNGMINPLIPYALKGVIWYQGESNGGKNGEGREYAKIFAGMINDWRARWGQGDFPFLFVQVPGWEWGYFWIAVRDSQLRTLALPGTGMAVAIDVGEEKEVHPKGNKTVIAHRLATSARHVAYGEDIVYSGPLLAEFRVEENKMRLKFSHSGSGLVIGAAPAITPGPAPVAAAELQGFEIAGSDNMFKPAKAQIEGDDVVVWSDLVTKPKAVRYAWAGFPKPTPNLYNKEGLPASPFQTGESPLYPAVEGR